MINNYYWFYTEPFVYISTKGSDAILYNSLDGKYLVYEGKPGIVRFIKRLQSNENLHVVKVSDCFLDKNPEVACFVKKVRKHFMGDIIGTGDSNGKPVQLNPVPYIKEDVTKFKNQSFNPFEDECLKYLNQLYIYLNSQPNQSHEIFKDAYRQFPCLFTGTRNKHEVDLENILDLISQSKISALTDIHISGGNILHYSNIEVLVKELNKLPHTKTYYMYYLFDNAIEKYHDILDKESSVLKVFITFPIQEKSLDALLALLNESEMKIEMVFIVQRDKELKQLEYLVSGLNIDDFSLKPYYSGSNLSFFRKHVFISKRSVLKSRPALKEIFAKTFINPFNFGKLTVMNDGNIYANVNQPSIGKLGKDSLYDVVRKEINNGRSWRKIRTNVTPCKNCVLNALCPPISNYEYTIGDYNVCKN